MTAEAARPSGREALLAAGIAAAGAVLFVAPIFAGWDLWGIADWDQHQFFYGVSRWSIAERGEAPFWNPFACGGNADLANPQSPALYPLFGVVLAAGVVPGLKILIWLHAVLAAFGAWLLGRVCGCGPVAAWLPAAAFGLSSAYALHLSAGHATWFAMAWLPFAFAGLRVGFERPALAVAGGAAAAMIVLSGNGYLFAFLLLFAALWAVMEAAARRSLRPMAAFAWLLVAAAGLAAVKLVPMAFFLEKVRSLEVRDPSRGSLLLLWHALLGRDQSLRAYEGIHAGQVWLWWEHGAYVGPAIPFLAALGLTRRPRRLWPLATVAAAALAVTLGRGWGTWDLLRALPAFEPLRVPSRVIVFAVLILGTLAGLAASDWEPRVRRALFAAGVAMVALDIGFVGRAAFREAFVVEPSAPVRGAFRQEIARKDFQGGRDPATGRYDRAYTDQYPRFLAGHGTVNCYDRAHFPARVSAAARPDGPPDPGYRGEAWLTGGGPARLTSIGGRRILIAVEPDSPGTLVVNQNFADGWRVAGGRPATEHAGLLAADVAPQDREIVFEYTPPGLFAGAAISLATLVALGALALRGHRDASLAGSSFAKHEAEDR